MSNLAWSDPFHHSTSNLRTVDWEPSGCCRPFVIQRNRLEIQLGFVLGYLRTEENHQLQLAPRLAAGLPQRALELLGFV